VIKWMRFYHYHPNTDGSIDRPRRDELKAHLNLLHGHGQKLASFINNKFYNFRRWGYLYWDGKNHVKYSASTDAWLSPNWDGHIERQKVSKRWKTRSPRTQGRPTKRQASTRLQQRKKRQKSMEEGSTMLPVTSTNAFSNKSANVSALPVPLPSQHQLMMNGRPNGCLEGEDDPSFHDNRNNSPLRTETNHVRRKQEGHSSGIEVTSPSTVVRITLEGPAKRAKRARPASLSNDGDTRVDEVGKYPLRGRHPALNPQELFARLEAVNSQSTSSMASGSLSSDHLFGARKHIRALGPLREKEKSCKQTLRESMTGLESTREEHRKLCQQYEALKINFGDLFRILDRNSRRQKGVTAPTPVGVVEARVADSLQDVVQNCKENDLLHPMQEEKSRLETQMAESDEAKSNLKKRIAANKDTLKELQRDIKETLELNAKTEQLKGRIGVCLDDFKDVGDHSKSGSISPVESVPESVSSEMSGVELLS
jgi:hypothetical protein